MKKYFNAALIGLASLILTNCGTTELILLPRPDAEDRTDREAFCNRDGNDLVIRISNVGPKDAASTKVLVEFPGFPSQTVTTPAIPGQSVIEVRAPIPTGCFNPDCDFKITVDPDDNVMEPREDNNVKEGKCIG